jgi:hypothetical protein
MEGSMTTTCLDSCIEFLNKDPPPPIEEYQKYVVSTIPANILRFYQDSTAKWSDADLKILELLFQAIDQKTDKKTQHHLCNTIESYLHAKNVEISTVRPV